MDITDNSGSFRIAAFFNFPLDNSIFTPHTLVKQTSFMTKISIKKSRASQRNVGRGSNAWILRAWSNHRSDNAPCERSSHPTGVVGGIPGLEKRAKPTLYCLLKVMRYYVMESILLWRWWEGEEVSKMIKLSQDGYDTQQLTCEA